MRRLSPLASYNRVLAFLKPGEVHKDGVHKTNLGVLAAGESLLLVDFVKWATDGC